MVTGFYWDRDWLRCYESEARIPVDAIMGRAGGVSPSNATLYHEKSPG